MDEIIKHHRESMRRARRWALVLDVLESLALAFVVGMFVLIALSLR